MWLLDVGGLVIPGAWLNWLWQREDRWGANHRPFMGRKAAVDHFYGMFCPLPRWKCRKPDQTEEKRIKTKTRRRFKSGCVYLNIIYIYVCVSPGMNRSQNIREYVCVWANSQELIVKRRVTAALRGQTNVILKAITRYEKLPC